MKFISFIITLYVVALSVYPCYEDSCQEEGGAVIEPGTLGEQEIPDICTPFCVSTCCSLQILSIANYNTKKGFQNSEVQNSAYTNTFTLLVIFSIWQPPKLA